MSPATALIADAFGADAAARAERMLAIDPAIGRDDGDRISRASFALALNLRLFDDLLRRVPTAAGYVSDVVTSGARVTFDHGALRTILMPTGDTGALPGGQAAFARILEPLGYHVAGVYPLPALKMTGRGYAHRDFPETIPQFFVSELHVDRFDAGFAAAAARVFGSSRDPLGTAAQVALAACAAGSMISGIEAVPALIEIAAAFDRQHDVPDLADYEILRSQSAEAAWIATEGNAFNHATDRVADVDALAAAQRALGRPMKDKVEVSATGRVRQTAFRADMVERPFRAADAEVARPVPGSFYEFITRDIDPATGTLDLSFDTGNATGIFAMTKGGAQA